MRIIYTCQCQQHISKTVKQRSHISMLLMDEALSQVENCLFSSSKGMLYSLWPGADIYSYVQAVDQHFYQNLSGPVLWKELFLWNHCYTAVKHRNNSMIQQRTSNKQFTLQMQRAMQHLQMMLSNNSIYLFW